MTVGMTMNRERAKELLPIITAFAEGKAIQYRKQNCSERWFAFDDDESPRFDIEYYEYRIKPEPRTVFVVYPDDGSKPYLLEDGDTANKAGIAHIFREVLE